MTQPDLDKKHRRIVKGISGEMVSYGLRSHFWQDIYYYTMTLSWPRFFAAVALLFVALNLFFAALYTLDAGVDETTNQT